MDKRKCAKCGEEKNKKMFYASKSYCKDCCKEYSKQRYLKNPKESKIKTIEWIKKNPGRAKEIKRKSRKKHQKKQQEYYKKWYKKNGRIRTEAQLENIKKWQKANPEKVAAQKKVRHQIQIRNILVPKKCLICGKKRKLCGHHPDYSKPLNIIWICYSCHKKIHVTNT